MGSCEVLASGKDNIVIKSRTTICKRNIPASQSDANLDATALRRGNSRSRLQNTSEAFLLMPRLVSWCLTLGATKKAAERFCGCPMPCAVEPYARGYQKGREKVQRMPRPCAVEPHVS